MEACVAQVLGQAGILGCQDLINSIADGERLGRVGLKPDLHPLHYERHDQLEDQKVVIRDHLEEIEHDLGQIVHIKEDWAPVAKSRQYAHKFVV